MDAIKERGETAGATHICFELGAVVCAEVAVEIGNAEEQETPQHE